MGSGIDEVERQLKRSSALRKAAAEMDRQDRRKAVRLGPVGRVLRFASRVLTTVVAAVMVANLWFAYDAFFGDEPTTGESGSSSDEPSYSDLAVFEADGDFGGTVTVTNPLDFDVEVLVEVDLYDGDQNVGDMDGSVTLKPDSESVVTLTGFDSYVEYDEARVDLFAFPK